MRWRPWLFWQTRTTRDHASSPALTIWRSVAPNLKPIEFAHERAQTCLYIGWYMGVWTLRLFVCGDFLFRIESCGGSGGEDAHTSA
ncbi:hypothetical protein NSPZN2_70132 [Nitrospira defluvii]|uniref:Uncharacterized protein n=1 Tax=Nitrospira defluvii TaxID=330214 RepID=A0ABN7MFQ8_9BACT|nr:hypothetical protein NSPZN2_70132 [Nitrospira defluvii]